ncbi:MAG: amidase domain-containing protein [Christensenella sp.]|nr:amidase domain-containing protein [Christensenella sp.]
MKSLKKLIFFVLAFGLFFSLMQTAFALESDIESDQETEIKSIVSGYFNLQHEVLSELASQERVEQGMNKASSFAANEYAEKFETVLKMALAHRSSQAVDLSYDKYDINLDYRMISITGSNATVKVFVTEQIYFNADPSVMSEAGTLHTITLLKQDNMWLINGDSFELDGYGQTYEKYKKQYAQVGLTKQSESNYILEAYSQEISQDIERRMRINELDENATNLEIAQEASLMLTSHNYDPTDPVEYAHNYCRTNNPSPWATLDLDCTNFTSIALNTDIPMDTSGNKWYWNTRTDRSASWASAEYFRRYIYNNNNSTSSNSGIYGKHDTYANCGLGDIIQYASNTDDIWNTDGRPVSTHSSIVTKVTTSGGRKLYVSMHSYGTDDSDYRYDYLVDSMPYSYKHYLNIVRYYS